MPLGIADGTYRIAAKVTVTGEEVVDTENNTGAGVKQTAVAQPFIDLAPTVTVRNARVLGGVKTPVIIGIRNEGNVIARGPLYIDLWASPDASSVDSDIPVTSMLKNIVVAPGQTRRYVQPITVPTFFEGPVFIKADFFDADARFNDLNSSNNLGVSGGSLNVWHKNVDLSGTWLFDKGFLPSSVIITHRNEVVKVQLNLTNSGTSAFSGPVSIRLRATTDPIYWNFPVYDLGTVVVNASISSGGTKTLRFQFTIPASLPSSQYFLLGTLDSDGRYSEGQLGENNNELPGGLLMLVQ
jgi:hypothetical protein